MDIKKVLFVSQEVAPYLPENPMSVVCRMLPQTLQEKGIESRTFMPKYGMINERRNQLHEVIRLTGMNVIINDSDHPVVIKVATLLPSRMQVYFIYNEDYFAHSITHELESQTSPDDNAERIIFYTRAVIESVRKTRWNPNVIHCSGWIGALAPLYMRKLYNDDPAFGDAKIVLGLCGETLPQPLDENFADLLMQDGFTAEDLKHLQGKNATETDLMKVAIDHCDAIMQCAAEINPEVMEYAQASGKPLMSYPGDEQLFAGCREFYNSL